MQKLSPNTELSKLYKQIRSVAFGVGRRRLFFLPEWALWDFAHDATTTVLLNLGQFRGKSKFSYWVVKAINNLAINEIIKGRRLRRDVELVPYDDPNWTPVAEMVPGTNPSPERAMLAKENLQRAFSLMSEDDKKIFHSYAEEGVLVPSFAMSLNWQPKQVWYRIKSVRERLIRHGIRKP